MRTYTVSKSDLAYVRARDEGRCRVGQFSSAHYAVVDPEGHLHIEVRSDFQTPRWQSISKQMTHGEIEKAIRKSPDISPQFKAVFLAMVAAGKEVR